MVTLFLITSLAHSLSTEPIVERSQSEQLLEHEIELISLQSIGLGQAHPRIRSLNQQIQDLKESQANQTLDYFLEAKATRVNLEKKSKKLKADGFGAKHPSLRAVQAQLEFLMHLEKSKLANSLNSLIEKKVQ